MEFIFELEDIQSVAAQILLSKPDKLLLFHAGMGVGKTTLIKALVRELGITEATSSPTFSIVNQYQTPAGEPVYHFDLYRIDDEEEAYDLGLDEYLDSGHWCFVEWPEQCPTLIPPVHSNLQMEVLKDGRRKITLSTTSI